MRPHRLALIATSALSLALLASLTITMHSVLAPAYAQTTLGIQVPSSAAPQPGGPEQGFGSLAEVMPHLPQVASVRVAWALLRITPTARTGRHTHAMSAVYHLSPGACEAARSALYDESPSSLCLPVAIPPY